MLYLALRLIHLCQLLRGLLLRRLGRGARLAHLHRRRLHLLTQLGHQLADGQLLLALSGALSVRAIPAGYSGEAAVNNDASIFSPSRNKNATRETMGTLCTM